MIFISVFYLPGFTGLFFVTIYNNTINKKIQYNINGLKLIRIKFDV